MRIIRLVLVLCIVFSCNKKQRPDPPEDLLTKVEMSNILYEMFIINSAKGSSMKVLQENGVDPDKYVLERFDIDSTRFVNSNNYYAYSYDDYREIMTLIEERISEEKEYYEEVLEEEQAAAKRRADSLRKVKPKKAKPKKPKS
ncbi:DUF4296 domain-containing protein [Winogradskyella aurantiaca]|uniref:DUF4296 domain-containing protein n=1 Tax=Winogradskyella aurantiaca TaxID=2219558 RepID=UPI000E1DD845|nr:DUF4296 domain-containing protein [Winogradskyella aurantiaca]